MNNSVDSRKIVRRNTQSITETIPNDLIFELFSRLPRRSIARCRCVTKQWASLLRSPDFTEPFLTTASTRPRLLFMLEVGGKRHFFSSPQPRNLDDNLSVLQADYHMGFSGDWDNSTCLSVYGFIYLIDKQMLENNKIARVPVICNPSTGQRLSSPKVRARNLKLKSFFGYDPINKQLKVLCMTVTHYRQINSREHQVLTLGKGHRSWKRIECLFPHYPEENSDSICINGVMYYIGKTNTSTVIACFDIRSEKFSFIEIEKGLNFSRKLTLINYKGKLGVIFYDQYNKFYKLWVLVDIEKETWSKHVFPLLPAVIGRPIWATDTGEIVLAPHYWTDPFYISYYNMKTKSVKRVQIKGIKEKLSMGPYGPSAISTFGNYVENQMSLS